MKQFVVLVLIAGALMVGAPDHALATSRFVCASTCDGNGSTSAYCSWATKRAKWNRCRTRLIKLCRRLGTSMCPAQTTTTTVPPAGPVTTTTTTSPPPTTTTVPVVVITYPNMLGSYEFAGTVTSDSCGFDVPGTFYTLHFQVTGQIGSGLTGTIGLAYDSAAGLLFSDDSWGLSTPVVYGPNPGCTHQYTVLVDSVYLPSSSHVEVINTCISTCTTELDGTV